MKTCRKGHSYLEELKRCPECRKIWDNSPAGKASKAKYSASPKGKASQAKRSKKYYTSPKGKANHKKYRVSPKGRATRSRIKTKYTTSPKGKATRQEYATSSAGKVVYTKYNTSSKGKARRKKYQNSPAGKINNAVAGGKRTKRASHGDLTTQQWKERLEEFEYCCAYCAIKLLTKKDGVDRAHPQYQTMDHIVSLSDESGNDQGEHTKCNVVPACLACNSSKLNKPVFKWLAAKNLVPSTKFLPILEEAIQYHQQKNKKTK